MQMFSDMTSLFIRVALKINTIFLFTNVEL